MGPSQALLKNCGYKHAFAVRATEVFVLMVWENHPNIRYRKEIFSLDVFLVWLTVSMSM